MKLPEDALDKLVQRAQEVDLDALQELAIMFRPRTLELVEAISENPECNLCIVQKTFRNVYSAAERRELDKNFSLWLCRQTIDAVANTQGSFVKECC